MVINDHGKQLNYTITDKRCGLIRSWQHLETEMFFARNQCLYVNCALDIVWKYLNKIHGPKKYPAKTWGAQRQITSISQCITVSDKDHCEYNATQPHLHCIAIGPI